MQSVYAEIIRDSIPDFEISSVVLNYQGQNSDVLIVNESWVFRFPKYEHVLQQFRFETALLEALQGRLPLAIPAPCFVNLHDQPLGRAYMGYRLIPGEPLWREVFRQIQDETTLDALAEQLAGFLHALHSLPVHELVSHELSRMDTLEEWLDIYSRMRSKLFDFMRSDARQWTVDHFENYLDEPANFSYPPVLKHSDFGTSNILYDSENNCITGIIDFSYAGLGDPAYDFAGLLSSYGETFIERCARFYPGLEHILPRVRFYKGTFALFEALFGIENDDQDAFQSGISSYV
jgi:aminoglycoside 2''-phosphotransferase